MKPIHLWVVVMLASCTIDGNKKVVREKLQFKTGDDSELFFKNVRSIYYDHSPGPDGKMDVYRWSGRYTGNERPLIVPAIVIHWLEDEAYILVENNEVLDSEPYLSVLINDSLTIDLRERGRERMASFCSDIYDGIKRGHSIRVKKDTSYLDLFPTEEDREAFRIPMSDYYRLTRVF
jgi:hypothetical protein